LKILKFDNFEIWQFWNLTELKNWQFWNLTILKFAKLKNWKFKDFKFDNFEIWQN
jgi:hypothetical protein